MKVLFAFRHPKVDNAAACHIGLGVTARNCALTLRESRIAATSEPVPNGEYLWAKLAGDWRCYTHVVMLAPTIDAGFLEKLVRHFPHIQFTVTYHSNVGFLTVDRFAVSSLGAYLALQKACPNFRISVNSLEFKDALQAVPLGDQCVYLPNLYHLPATVSRQRAPWSRAYPLRLGLFGATRILKNPLTAAFAALAIQDALNADVELHVNVGRDEGGGAALTNVRSIIGLDHRVKLVEAPWMEWDDFRRYLYEMDLLLQPSFTESFNNVTADGVACGVASVVSDAIGWTPRDWQAKADSVSAIAEAAVRLIRDASAPQRGWKALRDYNSIGLAVWKEWLGIAV